MSVTLYMDVHVRWGITVGLRLRGIDVLTAQEDETDRLPDPELMDRATAIGRVLFSHDVDLLREAVRRQRTESGFSGLIFAEAMALTIGQSVHDLDLIANVYEPDDMSCRIEYLPLQ